MYTVEYKNATKKNNWLLLLYYHRYFIWRKLDNLKIIRFNGGQQLGDALKFLATHFHYH